MNSSFNPGDWAWLVALGVFVAIIALVIVLALVIFYLAGKWKMYEKAGYDGWKAIVPFYNKWIYVEMAGLNSWYFLLLIANVVTIAVNLDENIEVSSGIFNLVTLVGMFFCNYNISKKLHKDTLFAALMTIFPVVVIPIVGFSKNISFDNTVEVSVNGPIDDVNNKNNNKTNEQQECSVDDLEKEKEEIEKRIKELKEEAKKEDTKKGDNKEADTKKDDNKKYCGNCGSKIEKNNKFCSNCGKEI